MILFNMIPKTKQSLDNSFCGFITIIGKPNVGKSTLLNKLIGKKISITTNKPQTTRHKILGIKTINNKQAIYVDTPGMCFKNYSKVIQLMNKAAKSSLKDADVILFVIESMRWDSKDEEVLQQIQKFKQKTPVFLILNKIDLISDHNLLLPEIQKLTEKYNFTEVFPISANKNINLDILEKKIFNNLPVAPHYFLNTVTDQNLNFRASEIIREKLIKNLSQELPYVLNVEITNITKQQSINKIDAVIWVEKSGQKKIVIGENGSKLKLIGTQARLDLEKLFNKKVFLTLWVQIKPDWTNNANNLKQLNII